MQFTLSSQNQLKFDIELDSLKSTMNYFPSNYCNTERIFHLIRSKADGWSSKDISFTASINGKPIFAFLGVILSKNNYSKISFFELPALCIESKLVKRSDLKKIFSFFIDLADGSDYISVRDLMHCGCVSAFAENLKNLSDNISSKWYERRLIDLTLDELNLRSAIRKSYRSLINKGCRELAPQIYTSSNISQEFIDDFRELHIHESSRETRPRSTWLQQLESVKEGFAFCTGAYIESRLVSAGYFITADKHCYYGVSASRRDMFPHPLFHSLLWTSILFAKSIGAAVFEIDSNASCFVVDDNMTPKQHGIKQFKSGFGGKIYPCLELSGHL